MATKLKTTTFAPLLNVTETAVLLRCSAKTVRRLIEDGTLDAVKLRGVLRIRPEDVHALTGRR